MPAPRSGIIPPMRKEVRRPGGILLAIPLAFVASVASVDGPALGDTLKEVLIDRRIAIDEIGEPNLSKEINYACLDDERLFGIAYRILEGRKDSRQLGDDLFLLLDDKSTGKWSRGKIPLKGISVSEGICDNLDGSPLGLRRSTNFFYVELHLTPSACATLVLTKDFAVHGTLCGWIEAISPEETVVYQNSMVHFAPTHSAEISVYNPRTGFRRRIYPREPFGEIRKAQVEKIRKTYEEIGVDWFRVHNHHADPKRSDCFIRYPEGGTVAIDDGTRSLAFIVNFEGRDFSAERRLKEYYFGELIRALDSSRSGKPKPESLSAALYASLDGMRRDEVDQKKSLGLLTSDPEIQGLLRAALGAYPGEAKGAEAFFASLDLRWGEPGTWKRLGDLVSVPPEASEEIVFLYRDVYSEKGAYQEFLLSDLRKKFRGASDWEILQALVKG
jgi:hypothetical protein